MKKFKIGDVVRHVGHVSCRAKVLEVKGEIGEIISLEFLTGGLRSGDYSAGMFELDPGDQSNNQET